MIQMARRLTSPQPRANKTDAGNGSKAICRVSKVLRSPSPDPRRCAKKMELDWKTLERVDAALWMVPFNDVIPFEILIHGGVSQPNEDALKLAKTAISYCDYFIDSAKTQIEGTLKPAITKDGVLTHSFHFDDLGGSFWIHFHLPGDSLARWSVRFIRTGIDSIGNHLPCELRRITMEELHRVAMTQNRAEQDEDGQSAATEESKP